MSQIFLNELESIIGKNYVLTSEGETTPYLTDWRKRYTGKALAVLLPSNTQEAVSYTHLTLPTNREV